MSGEGGTEGRGEEREAGRENSVGGCGLNFEMGRVARAGKLRLALILSLKMPSIYSNAMVKLVCESDIFGPLDVEK